MQALLQQRFRNDAKQRDWEEHQERLVRVAALNDAALFRSTHSARQHRQLQHQIQHRIRLSSHPCSG